jgi:hypothetical protein
VKRSHKWLAAGTSLAIATLLWPGQPPAAADTSLGGYEATASAAVVRLEIFDPTIPIPATPQIDGSVGYTNSTVETGPTTRALASYLWPGSVIGDGFDQLLKKPGATYPLQVNSRFPATTSAPAKNTIQLTDGNGMTTSSDGFNTSANVTLFGLAGDNTNVTGGLGTGLGKLTAKDPTKAHATPTLQPLPIGTSLAALITAENLTSTSTTTVADKTITAVAHAAASNIGLLGGLVKINGLDVLSTVVSDGTKSTVSGDATIGSVSILGLKVPISANGVNLGLPALSSTLTDLLSTLGLGIQTVPVSKATAGPQGEYHAQALVLTIDTKPLKSIVNNVLSPLFAKLPVKTRTQLQPILDLGPKIVLNIGTADATGSAAPAFNVGGFGGGGGGGAGGSGTGGSGGSGNTTPLGNGSLPGGTGNPSGSGSTIVPQSHQSSLALPPLGEVPRALILGALLVAGLVGWFFRRAAAGLLGSAGNCDYGLVTGVPDLRKG